MNCPVCEGSRMREVEKNGILIDVCPSCKGVWLDRGELDKLMEDVREVRQDYNEWYYGDSANHQGAPRGSQSPQQQYQPPQQQYQPQQQQHYPQHGHQGHSSYPKYKKKKSMMDVFGDLFGD
ncbi:zf-TFIIB domain-containing protein [Cohnella mopanensis]|uniref:TFIIB-type zinc ribbon-containing protein n=1 Tax=Cohnella mopanensis TaxID=2911966 RepID=UPI001EF7CCAB|nr:zf-TFIIB domain-containing protein [Cohnella mopanensis]